MKGLRCTILLLLATVSFGPLRAQESTGSIRGRITDQSSQLPLGGAAVRFGNQSTQTRPDGGYLLTGVPAGTDSLRVTMIGYAPAARAVTVSAGETVDMDVALAAQAAQLAELVVVGYGEQRQGNVTGAVTNVTSNEFNTGRVVTPTELIQNKVAGVQVVENNEPGGRTSIRIRGSTSTTASNEPLYVVDGQPLSGEGGGITTGRDPLNFLNPDDIASISVLRDAGAAAIYGTNAANGVVLITTKRGQQGRRAQVEYSGSVSASRVTRVPSMLNAQQFRAAVEQYAPGSAAQLQNANTDWFAAIDRTGFGQEHNVAVSGAGAAMDYRLSLNFLDQNGIIESNGARRISLGANLNQRLANDRLNLRLHLRGSRSDDQFTPLGALSNAAQYGPTQPINDPAFPTGYYDWPDSSSTSADNPVAIVNLAEEKATTYRGIGNVQAEYSLPWVKGLRANATLGFDVINGRRLNFTPGTLHREVATGRGGLQTRYDPKQVNLVLETYLNYTSPKPLGPGVLDLTGGYSFSRAHTDSVYYEGRGLSTDVVEDELVPAAEILSTVFEQRSKLISLYGRANYNINDKYIIAASVRRDGSSRFGQSNDFGTFPSVSVAWRLSQEPFLRGATALSDLKLRASWAKTGNQSFGNYLAYSSYQLGDPRTRYQFGNDTVTTARPSAVDPNIKWEQTRAFNIGLDFGFANQRITGSVDWYDKSTSDLLFDAPVAAFSNLSNFVVTNVGTMRNRGIELSLGARLLQGGERGLTWQADFTAAHNTNTLRTITPFGGGALRILAGEVSGGVGTRIQVFAPGEPINSFYVYEHIRENGKPIYRDVNGDSNINDQDLYVDQNGDGIINQGDLRPFHDPAPKWILGHSSYMALGNLDLGFTMRAYLGNYMYNNVASANGNFRELSAGSSPYNLHSSVLETGFATQQLQSDYFVEDASFLRLDNLTLGYSFNLRGQDARVFGTVQNLFTITGYSGVDPSGNVTPLNPSLTSPLNGIDNNIYPRSRTFSGGLSLRL